MHARNLHRGRPIAEGCLRPLLTSPGAQCPKRPYRPALAATRVDYGNNNHNSHDSRPLTYRLTPFMYCFSRGYTASRCRTHLWVQRVKMIGL